MDLSTLLLKCRHAQVICKERCLGLDSSEYIAELDGTLAGTISTGFKHGSVSGQEGDRVVIILPYLG